MPNSRAAYSCESQIKDLVRSLTSAPKKLKKQVIRPALFYVKLWLCLSTMSLTFISDVVVERSFSESFIVIYLIVS